LDVRLPSEPIYVLQDKLPIRQKQDMVVNGADLLKWSGKKGGPWVKEVLEDILEAIIHNELANDQQQIKNWLDHNYFHET